MKTAVIFRQFPDGDAIALFPNETADQQGSIMSYQTIGQHGAASPELIEELEPASEEQQAKLQAELVRIGYTDLEVLP